MYRQKTKFLDLKILAVLALEYSPKEVAHKLDINKWRVYHAIRRDKAVNFFIKTICQK